VPLRILFSLFACAALMRAAEPAPTVVFFGDSITFGFGLPDPDAQSYPALIQRRIDEQGLPWRVVNAGLSGDTTAGGLRRLGWTLREAPGIFVLALGANDGLRGIDPAVTQANLEAIIGRVRARFPQTRIVLAGMRMPPSLGADYVAAFDAVFPRVAREKRVRLIPFLLAGVGGNPALNQADGIHPNPAGAAVVAGTVWKTLAPLLEARSVGR
jgi:acyl-CoA thioesterase-1